MNKELLKHDFKKNARYGGCESFSVGIIQWIPKYGKTGHNPKDLKKSKSKVRVRGSRQDRQKVYDKAAEICAQLDAGTYTGPKTVNVTQ